MADKEYKKILFADLTLVLVSFIWGAGIPLSAVLARGITPLWAVALRMAVASVFLLLLFPKKIFNATAKEWKIS